ncbi:MAG: hypothetical protein JWQ10_1068 [Herbaspirillum sp.]|nr:hypothetical protein [Herbaspirillum sp.]
MDYKAYKLRSNLQDLLRQTVLKFVEQNQNALMVVMDCFDPQTAAGNKNIAAPW